MLKKNDVLDLEITDITNLGFGVARKDGQVVFVSGAVTGDVVKAKVIKVNKSYAIARCEEIKERSCYRCEGFCKYQSCKSCAYKELSYSYELELKKSTIKGAFLAEGLSDIEVASVTPSPKTECYRNKAQYPVSITKDGDFVIGFYAPKSHRVTEAADCPLAPKIFGEINETLREFFKKYNFTFGT